MNDKYDAILFETPAMIDLKAFEKDNQKEFLKLCEKYPLDKCVYIIKNTNSAKNIYAKIGILTEHGFDENNAYSKFFLSKESAIKYLKECNKKLQKLILDDLSIVVYYLTDNYTKEPVIDDFAAFEELEDTKNAK